jgi:hypothetical protein
LSVSDTEYDEVEAYFLEDTPPLVGGEQSRDRTFTPQHHANSFKLAGFSLGFWHTRCICFLENVFSETPPERQQCPGSPANNADGCG